MAFCLILGDSIALGIAAALSSASPTACDVKARVGASVEAITSMVPRTSYNVVIISAGSNDRRNGKVAEALVRLRNALKAQAVTWVYPRAAAEAWVIHRIARRRGDGAVGLFKFNSRDGVHPSRYNEAVPLILNHLNYGK
ncbi:hypothetical protein [Sphingobium sp.]|uniref:hypothetical protein n=1 Tax=Sphingobium sp. TaxID=1912891 RepID=UPI0028BD211B|nr:hypothetical protein [Sphingobium sp.]